MNTVFSLAAIGIIIIWGIWVGTVVLTVALFVIKGVWHELCAVSRLFTQSASAPRVITH
jgi:hypothetical protein